jgi:CDP-glucose 4,6-dehydratase
VEGVGVSDFWRDRPTLVTGASGLLGGWLVKALLAQGADVVCLLRDRVPRCNLVRSGLIDRVRVVRGDVTDREMVERVLGEYEVETVFHLAAQTIVGIAARNPISTFETNVRGTWCVLEACRRSPAVKQIVVASSDKAYGAQQELPYRESTPLEGRFPYDVSKSCADLIAQSYAATYGLPVAVTRCGNFYGGGDLNWNRIVPGTMRAILRNQRPVIRSDGSPLRDYVYIEDAAESYMLLAEKLAARPELRGEAFNFSGEKPLAAIDMVRAILRVTGSSLEPDIRGEAHHEIPAQYLCAAKARETLGWQPAYPLEEGLRRTHDWYRNWLAET